MSFIQPILQLNLVLLMVGMVLSFIRLIRGPSLPDRVIALDLMATLGIGTICVYAIQTNQPVLLDVALVFALLTFLGTIAFAYYIDRRR